MALDPNISLQGTPPVAFDPVGSIGKAASLKNLMIGNQYLEAEKQSALESQRLQQEQAALGNQEQTMKNEQSARELEAQKTLGELYKKHTTVGPNKIHIDHDAVFNEGLSRGLDIKTLHGAMSRQAEIEGKKISNVNDAHLAADKVYDRAMNLIRYAPDEQVPAILHVAKTNIDSLTRNVMTPDESADYSAKLFGLSSNGIPKDNAGRPDWPALAANLRGRATASALSTISPQQEVSNMAANVGPEDLDPTSARSADARARVQAAAGRKISDKLSYKDLMQDPQYAKFLGAEVQSAEERAAAARRAREAGVAVTTVKDAITALGSGKVASLGTKPGAIAADKWQRLVEQGGEYARVQGGIDDFNAANPGANLSITDGLDVVRARLRQHAAKVGQAEKGEAQAARSPTVSGATAPVKAPSLVKVTHKESGKSKWVTPEDAKIILQNPKYQ